MNDLARSWGQLIRQRRHDKGLRQVDLAELLSTDQSNISSWERGRSVPASAMQPRIVEALKITPEQLHALYRGAAA